MEDVYEKITKCFGLKAKSWSKQKTGIYIKTDYGTKLLRKTSSRQENLLFSHYVKEHLFSAGFLHIDRYIMSMQNLPFVSYEDSTYILSDILISELNEVDFDNYYDLMETTRQLAKMHILSADISNIGYLGNICIENPHYYKKRIHEINHIKKWVDSQSRLSDIDVLYIKNYNYYLKRIYAALELSRQINYEQLKRKITIEKRIVHNCFKDDNIKIDANNNIYIINFENSSFGSNVADLASLIRNYIKRDNFEPLILHDMAKTYREINPITDDEIKLLKAMLMFPYKYTKLINMHYNKRKTWISDAAKSRLQYCLEQNERQEIAIEQIMRLC